jgi:glycosyltransferase involved in cell wall biosynthesis
MSNTLLIISQVYPPEPASAGQHLADVALAMARRGQRVRVLTANRGYNDPSVKFPSREHVEGVYIRRLPFSSFGKSSLFVRLIGAMSFLVQSTLRGLFTRKLTHLLVSNSPPICAAAALVIGALRGARITYWVMDINPDQAVAMGWVKPDALPVKLLDWFNRRLLKRAAAVVTLDRFMAERILRKADVREKLTIMPPWPHDEHLEVVEHDENPFRHHHGLDDKFVFMFSGNHSTCTPLKTVLDAALELQDDPRLVFMFVGAGTGKAEVDDLIAARSPTNIRSLPYQPLAEIKYSLSAADVHLVVVGPKEVGLRHPCKVYGAMTLARPILLVGPDPCHASDLVRDHSLGWHIQHGDVERAIEVIREIAATDPATLRAMGERARRVIGEQLSQELLMGRFCDILAGHTRPESGAAAECRAVSGVADHV